MDSMALYRAEASPLPQTWNYQTSQILQEFLKLEMATLSPINPSLMAKIGLERALPLLPAVLLTEIATWNTVVA